MAEQPDDFWTFTPPPEPTPPGPPGTTPADHRAPATTTPGAPPAPVVEPPSPAAVPPAAPTGPVAAAAAPDAPVAEGYSPSTGAGPQESFDYFSRTMGTLSNDGVDPAAMPSASMGMPGEDSIYRSSATGGIASFKLRVWAYFTDNALLFMPTLLFFFTTPLIFEPVKGVCTVDGTRFACEMLTPRDQAIVIAIHVAIFFLFGVCNRIIAVAIWGASVGKMLVGIRIVSYTGKKIGFFRASWRFLVSMLVSPLFFNLGYWWAMFNNTSRTWHDYAAGTVVVEL